MSISVFDLFSIGIGPSSSHTVGPMRAARDFLMQHTEEERQAISEINIRLHGSLAFTGVGHGTDMAILMGLLGYQPETVDPTQVETEVQSIETTQKLPLLNKYPVDFHAEKDMQFDYEKMLPHHSNGMMFTTYNNKHDIIKQEIYYSVGGGFIVTEKQLTEPNELNLRVLPLPFENAAELIELCENQQCTIADLMLLNESAHDSKENIKNKLLDIAGVMIESINNGCRATTTILPGGLKVRRRAPTLFERLKKKGNAKQDGTLLMEWLDLFAIAVNEENAAGHRIVTAPTNGAAGIIPAVLCYYQTFYPDVTDEKICEFLLTAGAIGILYKKNASISGAEMGCQGEVGVACSMAAGALAAVLGGTIYQVENAAEIGMEHNLGLTCDPVKGLVQIPCIERNAMGAVKAVNAAQLALAGDGYHKVSLDMVIRTMHEIGNNMSTKYKETSQGGLAVNVIEC